MAPALFPERTTGGQFAPRSAGPGVTGPGSNRRYGVEGRWGAHIDKADAFARILQAARAGALPRMAAAIDEHMRGVVFPITQQRVPLDEGPLQATGRVVLELVGGHRAAASIQYGDDGDDVPYAVIQHENPAYRHAPGRTWKYVEGPMNENAGKVAGRLGGHLGSMFRNT